MAEFQAELDRRVRVVPGRYQKPHGPQALLEELVRERVLLERARAAGYDRDPDMLRRFDHMVLSKYREDHQPDVSKLPAPTPSDVESYYRAHRADFSTAEKVRVALILVKGSVKASAEKQRELRMRAEAVRTTALALDGSEPAFGDLAREHSDDHATRYRGGDCGWVERGLNLYAWPSAVVEAMFALKHPKDVSPVVHAEGSFYLLKLIDRQAASVRSLAEVSDRIAYQLAQQNREKAELEFHQRQRDGLRVEINQAAVDQTHAGASSLVRAPAPPMPLPAH